MQRKFYLSIIPALFLFISLSGQDQWRTRADFGGGIRYGAVAFSINDTGYIGLGSDGVEDRQDCWAYDPVTNVWRQVQDFPGGIRISAASFTIADTGYVLSGSHTPGDVGWIWYNDCWAYVPALNQWIRKASFPGQGRNNAVAFQIGDKGYIGTGTYRESRYTDAVYFNDFYEYDAAKDQWSPKAPVPGPGRTSAMGFATREKGYIGTGVFYYDTRQQDFYEFDPVEDKWMRKADFPGGPRYGMTGTAIGNTGYAGLGYYYTPFSDWYAYEPLADTWTRKTDFTGGGREQGKAFVIRQTAYVGTGDNNAGILSDIWAYQAGPVSIVCPVSNKLEAEPASCSALSGSLAPVFDPVSANPLLYHIVVHEGDTIDSGAGPLTGFRFPAGHSDIEYRLPQYPDQSCQFSIDVVDVSAPAVSPPPAQSFCYNENRHYTVPVPEINDNCGLPLVNYSISGATNRTGEGPDASGFFGTGRSYITWTAVDAAGNSTTRLTQVVVNPPLASFITNTYPLLFFGEPNTIYLGYGPTSAALFVIAFGGSSAGRYQYEWSTGARTALTFVSPSAPGVYPYSVKVTDAAGCQSVSEITIKVVDVRCGPLNDHVIICNRTGNTYRDRCINKNAVLFELFRGARLGSCGETAAGAAAAKAVPEIPGMSSEMLVYPNPGNGYFTVRMHESAATAIEWRILNIQGERLASGRGAIGPGDAVWNLNLNHLPNGTYILQVVTRQKTYRSKVIIQR